MAELIYMPKLGVNMTEGVIVSWLVEEGQPVAKGQVILDIETDKATQEVEAPRAGILGKVLYPVGETVPCTYTIAVITDEGEAVPEDIPLRDEAGALPEASFGAGVEEAEKPPPEPAPEPGKRVRISPAAKKLAKKLGVDYTLIQGTGGKGRIQKEDVQKAYEAGLQPAPAAAPVPAPAGQDEEVVPLIGIRGTIASRMFASAQTTARVTLLAEVDATQLVAWRDTVRRDYPVRAGRIGYNELLVVIVSRALTEFPYMNARLVEDGIRRVKEINVGVAVDTDRGLLVPVIKAAAQKDLFQIHEEFLRLVEAAQSGRINPDDLGGGTFTVTNLGMYEIEAFTPIINLPEASILGVGQIVPRATVVEDQIIIQKRLTLSLAFDHRLVDGAPAGRFLQRIKRLIEAPYPPSL